MDFVRERDITVLIGKSWGEKAALRRQAMHRDRGILFATLVIVLPFNVIGVGAIMALSHYIRRALGVDSLFGDVGSILLAAVPVMAVGPPLVFLLSGFFINPRLKRALQNEDPDHSVEQIAPSASFTAVTSMVLTSLPTPPHTTSPTPPPAAPADADDKRT